MVKRYHDNVSLPQGPRTIARALFDENTPKDEDDKNVTFILTKMLLTANV